MGLIRTADACTFYNYRADRGRQMTQALVESPLKLHFTTMTQYDKSFSVPFVLPKEHPNNILANVMAAENWKNLRIAETEKYAHVTYFFNGGNEKPYPGEEREMIPSPKVATYDLMPEMSAAGVAGGGHQGHRPAWLRRDRDELRQRRHGGPFRQIRAHGESGGNRGRLPGRDLRRAAARGRTLDHHRRSRQRRDDDRPGDARAAHVPHHNPVPFIVVDEEKRPLRSGGALQDIAPTILGMLHVAQPKEMTGQDLRQ